MAELSTFYCEETIRLLSYCGMDDGDYFAALVRMFGQALTVTVSLPLPERASLLKRLNAVRSALRGIGWGVEDDCDMLWQELVPEVEA